MKQQIIDLLDRLFERSQINGEQALWGILLLTLIFASVHLLTMLGTRWGDRRATGKALFFSIMIHLFCCVGLITIDPPIPDKPPAKEERSTIKIKQIIVEGEIQIDSENKSETPVWEKSLAPTETEISRTEIPNPQMADIKLPNRKKDIPELAPTEITEIKDTPQEVEELVKPLEKKREKLLAKNDQVIPIDIPEPQKTETKKAIPTLSRIKKKSLNTGQTDSKLERSSQLGSIDRIKEEFDPARELAAADVAEDPTSFLKKAPQKKIIRKREGSIPSPSPSPKSGVATGEENKQSQKGSPSTPKLERRIPKTQTRDRSEINKKLTRRKKKNQPATPVNEESPEEEIALNSITPKPDNPELLEKPDLERVESQTIQKKKAAEVPESYQLRNFRNRRNMARKYGGSEESEEAVERSLKWLSAQQSPFGFWDAEKYDSGLVRFDEEGNDRHYAGRDADAGITALIVLAYLGAGYTHEEGQYTKQVESALRWLVKQQRTDGYLGGSATTHARMYCHGMATFAIAEAYAMQSTKNKNDFLRGPVLDAVKYILDQQNPNDGGWRYRKREVGDMSMFGWQLMALKSAENAGIKMLPHVKSRMIKFLKDRSLGPKKGLAAYRQNDLKPTPAMTAEAFFSKQIIGIKRTSPASIEAVEYLLQHLPKRSETDLYYWYYGTLGMYQFGGRPWQRWNISLRDMLISRQRVSGSLAGSWDPEGKWGKYGGRLYSTALSTLCLEVYYRFLPIYRIDR